MCTIKMRNVSPWRLGPVVTSLYFKRAGEAVSSRGNPLDGALKLVEVVTG